MKKPPSGNGGSSHSQMILAHLQAGHSITALEALNLFNCLSLAPRIFDLRRQGHKIIATMITLSSGKRVAEYRLES
jgi:Helix-turn-helix domain